MFNALFQGGPMMPEQRPFNTQLRCYSAPFYEGADSHKINELNHGGKVSFFLPLFDSSIRYRSIFYFIVLVETET